jgi:hypothetical protein
MLPLLSGEVNREDALLGISVFHCGRRDEDAFVRPPATGVDYDVPNTPLGIIKIKSIHTAVVAIACPYGIALEFCRALQHKHFLLHPAFWEGG